MKLILKYAALFATLATLDSCAFLFNDKEVSVRIDSNPQGADIMIAGKNYGKTPATISLEPNNYMVSLSKQGHGATQFQLESWQAIRSKSGDGGRCIADVMGTMLVLPALSYWSVYCRDFKKPQYFVDIPQTAGLRRQEPAAFNGGMDDWGQVIRGKQQYQDYYDSRYGY